MTRIISTTAGFANPAPRGTDSTIGRGFKAAAAAMALALALGACAPQDGPRAHNGAFLGAALGGLVGSAFGRGSGKVIAVATGAMIGGVAGHAIGRSMDKADREYAQHAVSHSMEHQPSGQHTTWRNPDSGNTGTVTPSPAYENPNGEYCREYQHTVTVGGQTENAYGTACRQPDGSWRIVNG